MNFEDKIKEAAKNTLKTEADSIHKLTGTIDDNFVSCVKKIAASEGRVVVTGIGKSALIANKIVATLNSTGTPALFMHAADAIHGDLGMMVQDDVVICLSKSGESPEIKVLVPLIKNAGNTLIAIAGNINSYLAKQSDYVLDASVTEEACPNNLAPTASTAAQMALGDAIAMSLIRLKGFDQKDFAKVHPGGALGKKLYMTVSDFSVNHEAPAVNEGATITDVILEITSKRLGATAVFKENNLTGIITDGDIRRMLEKNEDISNLKASDIMGKSPHVIDEGALAVDALQLMRNNSITQLIVMKKTKYKGMIHLHDLVKEGIV